MRPASLRGELAFAERLPVSPIGDFREWVTDAIADNPAATPALVCAARRLVAAA